MRISAISYFLNPLIRVFTSVTDAFLVYSKLIKEAIKRQEDLLSEAAKEVEEFCEEYSWVANIQAFISSWGSGQMHAWTGQPAQKIEVYVHISTCWIHVSTLELKKIQLPSEPVHFSIQLHHFSH